MSPALRRASRPTGTTTWWPLLTAEPRSASSNVGNEHEAVPRVDEPIPRTGSGDDERAGAEVVDVVDIVAVADEAGADDGERFFPGGCGDGDRAAGAGRGRRGSARRSRRDRRGGSPRGRTRRVRPGPPLPPGVGGRHVTGLAAELLGDPVVDAWRPLQPRLKVVGIVGADVGPRRRPRAGRRASHRGHARCGSSPRRTWWSPGRRPAESRSGS